MMEWTLLDGISEACFQYSAVTNCLTDIVFSGYYMLLYDNMLIIREFESTIQHLSMFITLYPEGIRSKICLTENV